MNDRPTANVDVSVTRGFGDEWTRFDQTQLAQVERQAIFDEYFRIFPWDQLSPGAIGADLGCGSGRWAAVVAPRVGKLLCVDASAQALAVARRTLRDAPNCEFLEASVGALPIPEESLDFAYSLGVLHHIPDTAAGLRACVTTLKKGAPFLVYLYYKFDNRPFWYAWIWKLTEAVRWAVSRLPFPLRYTVSQLLALLVYWPLARGAALMERFGLNVNTMPLSYYRDKSLYVMRTDALDRFGTRLERRFTRSQIEQMMKNAGLKDIRFNDAPPYWCAVGIKS
jgi:ubiquinone/menaquinone biosynthesis C-methylase UbiE